MPQEMDKLPNQRIQWFHSKVLESSYPNAMRLSERFGISHRQAQRDVELMIHKLGAPLCYSAEHRGYYYSENFVLPIVLSSDNDELYANAGYSGDPTLFGAQSSIVQMQLPYTATIELSDKLTALELSKYIRARIAPQRYACEFHAVEPFLAALVTADTEVRLIEPDWLRERLIHAAQRVLAANAAISAEKEAER